MVFKTSRGDSASPMRALCLAILLLSPLLGVLPVAQAKGTEALLARWEGDTLVVNATGLTPGSHPYLYVDTQLIPGETTIAREVPLNPGSETSATVRMDGLLLGDFAAVYLYDAPVRRVPGTELPDESGFYDVNSVGPAVLTKTAVERQPVASTLAATGHRIAALQGDFTHARILATTQGILLAAWEDMGQLRVARSTDDGQSWRTTLIGPSEPGSPLAWAMRQVSDARVEFAWQAQEGGATAWHLVGYDVATGSVGAPIVVDVTAAPVPARCCGRVAGAVLDGGEGVLAATAMGETVAINEADVNGTWHGVGSPRFGGAVDEVRIFVEGNGAWLLAHVALPNGSFWQVTRSTDRGYTWEPPVMLGLGIVLDVSLRAGHFAAIGSPTTDGRDPLWTAEGSELPLSAAPLAVGGSASGASIGRLGGDEITLWDDRPARLAGTLGGQVLSVHLAPEDGATLDGRYLWAGSGVALFPDHHLAFLLIDPSSTIPALQSVTLFGPIADPASTRVSYGGAQGGARLVVRAVTPDALTLLPGASATVTLRIENVGDAPGRPALLAAEALGIRASAETWAPLPSHASADYALRIDAPANATPIETLTLQVVDLDGDAAASAHVSVEVRDPGALQGALEVRPAVVTLPANLTLGVSVVAPVPIASGTLEVHGAPAGVQVEVVQSTAPGARDAQLALRGPPGGLREAADLTITFTTPQGTLEAKLALVPPAPPTNLTRPSPAGADALPEETDLTPVLVLGAGVAAIAVTGAAAAAASTDAGKLGLAAATLPLYTRLARGDVLQNEVRAGIHAHVVANPGVRYENMRRALGLSNGAIAFHLRVLEREGYLSVHKDWTRRRYYATGRAPPGAARGEVAESVTRLLRESPGLGMSEVARRLGISRQLAGYHLRRLEAQGALRRAGNGWFAADR